MKNGYLMRENDMKKLISLVLALVMVSLVAVPGFASENESDRIYFEDGSYLTITIQEMDSRAAGTKSGGKTYAFTNNSGEVAWKAVIVGTFSYTGTTAVCTNSSCDVTVYDSAWYEVSKTVGRSGATATCELTMGKKLLGITVSKKNVSMTLTCDANGNLS